MSKANKKVCFACGGKMDVPSWKYCDKKACIQKRAKVKAKILLNKKKDNVKQNN